MVPLVPFFFFCRPGARTPRVSGGALRASAAEIVHTYMHMMNSGRSRDPPPYTTHGEVTWRESYSSPVGKHLVGTLVRAGDHGGRTQIIFVNSRCYPTTPLQYSWPAELS